MKIKMKNYPSLGRRVSVLNSYLTVLDGDAKMNWAFRCTDLGKREMNQKPLFTGKCDSQMASQPITASEPHRCLTWSEKEMQIDRLRE